MGKKTIYEVVYGKGRGAKKVLVDSKKRAEKMKKSIVDTGLFGEKDFKINPITLGTDGGIQSLISKAKKKAKKIRRKRRKK